ncbi:MAG: diguanylate cyclase [Oscillospiraceae bacterium]|nr:diguanylate cyclase [Oscillospiraceae bacterium]
MSEINLETQYVIGIYIPFLIVTVFVHLSNTNRRTFVGNVGAFTILCYSVLGMFACELVRYLINDPGLNIVADNGILMFTCLAMTAQFLLTYWFYRSDFKMPGYITMIFFIFPVLFAIAALSPGYFMVIELFEMRSAGQGYSIPNVDFVFPGWEMWSLISTIYSYLMIATALIFAVFNHLRRPKFNMLPSVLMIIAILLTVISSVVTQFNFNPTNLNTTIIAVSTTTLLYHLAILNHNQNFYARYARLAAFEFLKDFVVIFGKNGNVADFNDSASEWFSSVGIDLGECTYDSLMEKLKELGATIGPAIGKEKGEDISITNKGLPMVLNLIVFDLDAKKKSNQGTIAFFFDVTQNREMFQKLEKRAGVDALSGLPNRMAFDRALKRYDKQECLPLTVIMGDLNDLKKTNDNLGHKYGDLLIKTAAKILEGACRKPHFVARLGGDEFVMLLYRTEEKNANKLIELIKAKMAESSETLSFKVSMAMGAATKRAPDESLEDLIAVADKRLYIDKKAMKGEAPR